MERECDAGQTAAGEYYLEYNLNSTRFPRNIFHGPKLRRSAALAADLPDGAKVLDAGCASGYVSEGMAPRLDLTGVDMECEAVTFCRAHRVGRFLQADLRDLPFPSEFFDLVIFTNTIEHLESPRPVLRELSRVLKQRGKMLVTTENCANLFWLVLEQTWYRFFGGPCKPYLRDVHPQRYTRARLGGDIAHVFDIISIEKAVFGMELIAVARKKAGV